LNTRIIFNTFSSAQKALLPIQMLFINLKIFHLHMQRSKQATIFVLEGAFEAEGRLLHSRDGLALWDTNEIEIEALSNDAIILLIEITL